MDIILFIGNWLVVGNLIIDYEIIFVKIVVSVGRYKIDILIYFFCFESFC